MPSFHLKAAPTQDPSSGITGSPDIEEPATTRQAPVDPIARLRRAWQLLTATAVAIPRLLALVWRVSPWLTVGLATGTIMAALVPAGTAVVARLLINSVSHAIAVHSGHLADQGTIGPVAGVALHTTATGAIIGTIVIQLLLLLVNALASALRNVASQLLQQRVSQDIQLSVMEHASKLELAFFEDAASYDLIRQAQQEASVRPVTMIENLYGLAQSVITFASVVALLVALNPWVAMAALVAPVPAFLVDARFGKMGFVVTMWSSPIRRRMQYLSTLVTTDTYAKEVKLFGLGGYFAERFRVLSDVFYQRFRRQVSSRSLASTLLGTLTNLVTALTYLYVALLAVAGRVSLGDLVMYTVAATTLQMSAQTMFNEITGMYENNLYLNTLYRMLATRPAIMRPAHPVSLPEPLLGHIVVENVSFSYPGTDLVALRNVSFEIRPGQTMAVVGRNGAGKSTLVKLVCRLYDPTEGRILLDGVDLRDVDPEELRARISATFQDYATYQASAAENIGLGDCSRIEDRARIEAAAVNGGAHDLISHLPNGYDTPLGKWFEGGVNLSGGEWQKVALSRAFVRDSRILVFDEPTSALDPTSEHELFARLHNLAAGRSTIYVSHRFSTVRRADRILLLSGGRAAEQGTHRELLDLGGEYADLFHTQASAYVDIPAPLS
ncbi:MAG TPA: ABC transporter ATP-binding protein [Pseudonocardiaceae bacterium]|nr:ABC transporter ATP-binding protein [Pseudonocardiaceae bacterium]